MAKSRTTPGSTPRSKTDYSPSSRKARIRKRKIKQRRANCFLSLQVLVAILAFAVLGLLIFDAYGPPIDKKESNFWLTLLYALIFAIVVSVIVFLSLYCLGVFNEEEEEEEEQEQED